MASEASATQRSLLPTLLVLIGCSAIAAGYWGPWVWSEAAGLRILGLDLAEYVKFLAEVRNGQISLQREVFYLPLITLSLSLSLLVHRPELRLYKGVRWLLNLLAIPVALSMLPPAWTPPLLRTPEFSNQTLAIGFCLIMAAASYPLLRRLPWTVSAALVTVLAVGAIVPPVATFYRLQTALASVYGSSAQVGHGPALMALGCALLSVGVWTTRSGRRA